MKFLHRRIRNFAILAVVVAIVYATLAIIDSSLNIQQFYSGWFMIIMITSLLLFYVKKHLSVIPMGKNAAWAQWHYYIGLLLLFVFARHVDFGIPDGSFELAMFILFAIVICTGAGGAMFNRIYARRLASLEEEVIFERISQHRQALRIEVEGLLLKVVDETDSDTLSNYYLKHLSSYFDRPRHLLSHLLGSGYATLRVQQGLERQMRYLNSKEAEGAVELKALIRKKDLLDRHFALQGFLKHWGMLHFPIALAMSCLIILHIVLVYAFKGGL